MKSFAATLALASIASAVELRLMHPHSDLAGSCECLETAMVDVYFGADGEGYVNYEKDGETFEYPANYGLGKCDSWDADKEGDGCADADGVAADDAEEFCGYKWCYVSAECDVFDTVPAALNEDFSYSYANCASGEGAEAEGEDGEEADADAEGEDADADAEGEDETGICECLADHGQEVVDEDGETHIIYAANGEDYKYPADYGLNTCGSWDADLDPFCADNEESYCEAMWCYVSLDCAASDNAVANLNMEIAYSYATCGDSATFPNHAEETAAAAEGEEAAADGEDADAEGDDAAAAGGSGNNVDIDITFKVNVGGSGDDEGEDEAGEGEGEGEGEGDEEAAEEEGEEEEEEEEAVDETGICECLADHGVDVFTDAEGAGHIHYRNSGVDYERVGDYGQAECAAWDADLEPFCADNAEDYCEAMWCYVSLDCAASDVVVSNINSEIAYSYATCGDSADFPDGDEEGADGEGATVTEVEELEEEEEGIIESLF